MKRLLLSAVVLVLLVFTTAAGQSKTTVYSAAKGATSTEEAERAFEAERILKERRANAQSLLINLAVDARNYVDPILRARTQARIADALWEADRERSRSMFRSAWEAAELADAESQRKMQEDIKQQQAKTGRGGYVIATPPDLRREVLSMVARRDRVLGEELLTKFREQKEREAAEAKNICPNSTWPDPATAQRLELAQELIEAGEIERGLQFADPVLRSINIQSIEFLTVLRDKGAAAADLRYMSMLVTAAANPQSDANTVSMLTSYIFTPHLYITLSGGVMSSWDMRGSVVAPEVSPEMRSAYFRAASAILLRPLPPPGQDQTSSGTDGQFVMIKRLLPLFEQYAPQHVTTAMRAQLEVLASVASENARKGDDERLSKGLRPEKPSGDREQTILDQIDRAKTSAERDQLYLQLGFLMSHKGDLRARDYVEKIDEMGLRKAARAYIDASMVVSAIGKKDAERALEIGKNGELNHFQKGYLYAQAAKLLAKTDRERALSLIEDALAEARRIETSDPDRPRAFFGAANALWLVNQASVWDLISDTVKAAHSAETFTGEDGQMVLRLISKGQNSVHQSSVADFDVAGIFQQLARENYEKAVESARGFERVAPRANAVIAIARTILEEKK